MLSFNELKEFINSMPLSDRQELFKYLEGLNDNTDLSSLENSKFSNGIFCPKCGCIENIVKFGKYKEFQRYKCKDCSSTFTAKSNSIFHKSTKSMEIWRKYIDYLLNSASLRKSARLCGISLPTAFFWRHKILDALRKKLDKNKEKLQGIIESDETYFRLSFKGSRRLPIGRKPHTRGEKASKRGLSKEQVCIACGLDRQGNILSKMSNLGKVAANNLIKVYSGKVEKQSIFCTDSEKAYIKFAEKKGYKLVQIKSGKHKLGIYHINHVNAFHNNLKQFMDKFRGVATKYLDNYLTWNLSNKLTNKDIFNSVNGVAYNGTCRQILKRPAIPVN